MYGIRDGKIALFVGKNHEKTIVWLKEEYYCSKDCYALNSL